MEAAKLHVDQENPIDYIFIRAANAVAPFFKSLGATPNFITTLSVIASILASWSVLQGNKASFVVWGILSYFFDCLDGHFARRYDMCTKFGDYYDHLTDWLYYGLLFYAAFGVRGLTAAASPWWWLIYGVIIVAATGMCWHFGCQESIYAAKREATNAPDSQCRFEAPTLCNFVGICPNPHENIAYSRWCGCGTFAMLVIAIIVLFVR